LNRWERPVVCELAKRFAPQATTDWDYPSPKEVLAEIAALTPIYGGISYERLEAGEVLHWPCRSPDDPGTPYLHKGKFARGKGKFHAVTFKEAAELPDEEYPLILTTGRIMFHWHTGTMTRRSEKLDKEVSEAYVEISAYDADALGIGKSERVRISSRDRGACLGDQTCPTRGGVHPLPLRRGRC